MGEKKMSKPFMLQAPLFLAVMLASACSVQRVDEAAARAEATAESDSRYAAIQHNKQQELRDTVIFRDKPGVSTQPVVARRGIPSKCYCEVAYRPAGSVGIAEIAQYR
ncbi:Unknown protein sequence [Pseudomonas syringae pv. viburni]|uniref:Lipoprotein n=2 Tax=Pseudomonas syringae group TaxID=136849 RepID=A0A0Q0DYQ7_9PSED|nr:Unknown protein sequence [Pseudomonas syringae pv. viburni]